jgi:hypothetical protein
MAHDILVIPATTVESKDSLIMPEMFAIIGEVSSVPKASVPL